MTFSNLLNSNPRWQPGSCFALPPRCSWRLLSTVQPGRSSCRQSTWCLLVLRRAGLRFETLFLLHSGVCLSFVVPLCWSFARMIVLVSPGGLVAVVVWQRTRQLQVAVVAAEAQRCGPAARRARAMVLVRVLGVVTAEMTPCFHLSHLNCLASCFSTP